MALLKAALRDREVAGVFCRSVALTVILVTAFLLQPDVTVAQNSIPISCGETRPGKIMAPSQIDTYTFSGNEGEAVLFAAVNTSGTLCAKADLYRGSEFICGNVFCNSGSFSCSLPSTDIYTIRVFDDNLQDTGDYNLSLQFTTGRCGEAIACGQTLSGNIGGKAELDAYSFSANAGEAVVFAAVSTSGMLCAKADLYGPAGEFIGGNVFCNSGSFSLSLPSTGIYTILVFDDNLQDTGTYNMSLSGNCPDGSWVSLGGATPSEPEIVIFNDEPWVFVRGTDDRIYQNRLTMGSWTGWGEVPGGGRTSSGPAAVVFNNALYLFVRGTDNGIYLNLFNGVSWSGWSAVPGGGLTLSGPGAAVFQNALYLTVRGTDDRIYDNLLVMNWTGWIEVPGGGLTPSGPAAVVFNDQLRYFVRGTNDRIYQNRLGPGLADDWTGWIEVLGGGLTPAGPGAAATANTLYPVVRGTDNAIYYNTLP